MGKKTKSKSRLDQYYHIAKETGYRSRAAFKLIQLNKKYAFLEHANAIIDLCCAPGSWLQVAAKFMSNQSIRIGIDLVPTKPIKGCKTFQEDITTQSCLELIKKELKGKQADVVLNDGAPNVGGNWNKDAYNQSELVLFGLRIACMFLRKGGTFITKVFRSNDYNSLIWVCNKFFEKVEATKPKASRFSSAEIFVICQNFISPEFIDKRMFDPEFVLKDTESDIFKRQVQKQVCSIEGILKQKKNRSGYADNVPPHFYKQLSLTQFIEKDNPYPVFLQYNKILISQDERSYLKLVKGSEEIELICEDIKVLGKRQIGLLLKLRSVVRRKRAQIKDKEKPSQSRIEAQVGSEQELEQEILQHKKEEIKKQRKQREQLKKSNAILNKRAVQNQYYDEQLELNMQVLQELDQQIGQERNFQPMEQELESKEKKFTDVKDDEENIEAYYQWKKQQQEQKSKRIKKINKYAVQVNEQELKAKTFNEGYESDESDQAQEQKEINYEEIGNKIYNSKWFDKNQIKKTISLTKDSLHFDNPLKKTKQNQNKSSKQKTLQINDMQLEQPDSHRKKNKQLIELVPQRSQEDYTIQSLAETLAIAKKMLRKKVRQKIIDQSYNRYAYEDDNLPTWFLQDQKKHNFKTPPITKQQYQAQKNRLLALNAKQPKKILQAKLRKKKKYLSKLKKATKKAQNILGQEGINQQFKIKQVNKIYKKQIRSKKPEKKYIVGKKTSRKAGRNVRYVDSRLKKDKQNLVDSGKKIRKNKKKYRRRRK